MINNTLISNLQHILGSGTIDKNKGQVKFFCPICHHRKQKLEVCVDDSLPKYQNWNCWTCGQTQGTKGKSILTLLIKLNVTDSKLLDYAKSIKKGNLHNINKPIITVTKDSQGNERTVIDLFEPKKNKTNNKKFNLQLPKEFIPLYKETKTPRTDIEYRNALYYLLNRGVTKEDIISYRIGYCDKGDYKNKIILPSYDSNNQLNFFAGRAYYEDDTVTHKNPPIPKDIIGFENRINWNYPIILVEGGYDAIATKRNVIPLFGKTISEYLKLKVIEKKVNDIYIALDNDAIKDAIEIIKYFMNDGISVYTIKLDKKDPAKIGYKGMIELINNTKQTTKGDLIKMKLFLK